MTNRLTSCPSVHALSQATFLELYNEEITDLLSTDDDAVLGRDPKAKGLMLMVQTAIIAPPSPGCPKQLREWAPACSGSARPSICPLPSSGYAHECMSQPAGAGLSETAACPVFNSRPRTN